ncbi:MAG: PQQ-like beta-propeller repeat protein [Acidobacteria bacterium]|nr:PQQ-like beta-propeller repeat protein [Acidobacteriota bacterium]
MSRRRKVNLTFVLFLFFVLSIRSEEKNFPLEIDVIFSPCPCGDKVYLFSDNGRNQILRTEDDAPNCNLFLLNPIIQPICIDGRVFVADRDGSFYFLSSEETKPVGKAEDNVVSAFVFNEKLFIVYENSLIDFSGEKIELPFKVHSAFVCEKGIFAFGEKDFIFYKGAGNLTRFSFVSREVKGAVALEQDFVICGKKAIFFLNKKGRVSRKFEVKADILSIVALDDEKVTVASSDHFIRLFDRKGNVLWQYRMEGIPIGLAKTKMGIIVAAQNGNSIILIDPKKGTEIWSYKTKQGEIRSLVFYESKAIYYTLKENLDWVLNFVEIPQ